MLTPSRAALPAALALAALLAQDAAVQTHDVEVTVTEGVGSASASPDRHWIAFDLLGSIWVIPFGGGTAKKITPDSLEASHPTWSPDGTKIAFSALTDDGGWHLVSIGTDGTGMTQLTDGPFEDVEPVWSDEGARMLFASDRGGEDHTLWELTLGSRATRRVVDGAVSHFAWASHGDIAFLTSNLTLKRWEGHVIHAGGDELVSTTPIPGAEPYPVWNPYSETLHWGPQRQWLSDVETLETRRGQIVRLTTGSNSRPVTIGFSAVLRLTRADYAARHRVLEPAVPQPLRGILNPVISRDGTKIAFAALGDIWVQPIRGLPLKITDDQFLDLDPAWSTDGTRLAFSSDRSGEMQLWMHDFRRDTEVQLTGLNPRIPQEGALGAAWSPDGTRIAYRREESWSMMTLPGATPPCRPAAAATSLAVIRGGRPSWGADSCAVALSALLPYAAFSGGGVNQLVIEDLISGSPRVELLFPNHSIGDRRGSSPVWSPDGFRFAFVADGRLWSVPVDPTGKPLAAPSLLADDVPESPSWQGDSEHVVYLTPTGLQRTTGIAPESIGADVMWAPELSPDRVIVHAGRFFDGRLESVRLDVDITIDRGIVTSIDPHTDDARPGTVIDASDQFVMPGFVDPRLTLDPAFGEAVGRILLAYGITTVRDVSLNTYAGVEQQESLANGRRIGPRVFITGDPFDGRRVRAPGGISIASREALDVALRRAALLGVDALHARERLAGPLEHRLVDEAHIRGLRASTDSLFSAMTFGFDELALPVTGSNRNTIDIISRSGLFWIAPLARSGFLSSAQRDPSIVRDPRLALFPRAEREHYHQIAENISNMAVADDREEQAMKPFREGVAAVFKAGGRVVAGSESGIAGQPYGLGLHVELEQLVLAGLTPFQAIQAATVTAADALGASDAIGSIEVGKLGDLVFLGGDPLQDITKTRDVRAVMRGGRYYNLAALGVLQEPPR